MDIKVKFFASLREKVGIDAMTIDATTAEREHILTVDDVWRRAAGIERPDNTLAAVNHDYVEFDHPVRGGDEVAFFPPVTGG
ncbi:MAG: molybdopterin converting factor subunit 1 [Halothiobacillaceae bacterium]